MKVEDMTAEELISELEKGNCGKIGGEAILDAFVDITYALCNEITGLKRQLRERKGNNAVGR